MQFEMRRYYVGANPTQAAGVIAFLIAFVFVALALMSGGNLLWFLIAAALLALSVTLFLRAKPWENAG
jgi:hypothetical protein